MTGEAEKAPEWQIYKSSPPKPNELANVGLPALIAQDEYVFALIRVSLGRNKPKPGSKNNGDRCDLFYTIWQEEQTKNLLKIDFRVDQLGEGWKKAKNPKFERGIVQFFDRIGLPMTEGKEPNFGNLFIQGMRFRARVDVGVTDGKPNGYYHLNMPTARRYMQ